MGRWKLGESMPRAGCMRCGGHTRDLPFLFHLTGLDESLGGKFRVLLGVAELGPLKTRLSHALSASASPSHCRLRNLPPHPPCALHRLHPAVQRAPLHGTRSAPQLLPPLSPLLPVGSRSENPAWGGYWLTRAFCLFPFYLSLPLSPCVSASLQDRMVLLVMGNIINWSL